MSPIAIIIFRIWLLGSLLGIMVLSTAELTHPVLTSMNDKLGHVLAFVYLAFLVDFSFSESRFNVYKVFLLLAYGLLIESVQYFLPHRMFSLLDLLADGGGIALYALLIPIFRHIPLVKLRWRE